MWEGFVSRGAHSVRAGFGREWIANGGRHFGADVLRGIGAPTTAPKFEGLAVVAIFARRQVWILGSWLEGGIFNKVIDLVRCQLLVVGNDH